MGVTKPQSASGYKSEETELVESLCLYVATLLGDLLDDLVVVGGLVPLLLIDRRFPINPEDAHCGTNDLDLAMALALLDESRYAEIAERLRHVGFEPDTNDEGRQTPQRWRLAGMRVTLDFLIPPAADERGGTIRHLEGDFGALVAPGLTVAFHDREQVHLSGRTPLDEAAQRDLWVCGPGAFLVLKALAFHLRSELKDAFDLFHVVKFWPDGPADIAARIEGLRGVDKIVDEALAHLASDFASPDHVGPRAVARFLREGRDEDLEADAFGLVQNVLDECRGRGFLD